MSQRSVHLAAALVLLLSCLLGSELVPSWTESVPEYAHRIVRVACRRAHNVFDQFNSALTTQIQADVQPSSSSSEVEVERAPKTPSSQHKEQRPDAKKKKGKAAGGRAPEAGGAGGDGGQEKKTEGGGEDDIEQQQRLSVERYIEARKEVLSKEGGEDLVMPEHPDAVRRRMPKVSPDGPELRCKQKIPTKSCLTTRSVEVCAQSKFQGKHGKQQHAWSYTISFKNHGTETVQMLTRHWLFVDKAGKLISEVKGPGARGVTPVLTPGASWSYESGASLPTPVGSMHGSFQFEILKDHLDRSVRSFSARVARLLLSVKADDEKKVPCPSEAAQQALPLTSVFVTERVILGATSEVVGQSAEGKSRGVGSPKFQYDVQFNNARESDIEVVGHSWTVVDSDGRRQVVSEGMGVGGVFGERARRLAAGDAFRVQGMLESPTPFANAEGVYKVIVRTEDGVFQEIEARTDYMGLSSDPGVVHVPNFVKQKKKR